MSRQPSADLNEPKTIDDFAAIVQSPERLKLLLVLTVADIRGVGPTIWNGWKAALMRDLYNQTDAVLRGADAAVIVAGNAEVARQAVWERLDGWDEEEFNAYAMMMRQYWTGFDTESQLRHAVLGHLPFDGRAASCRLPAGRRQECHRTDASDRR